MTFSLAGRCARTGMLGGVITTSSPAVGSRCLYARAGVGVMLTQNRTDPRLGPRGIALLAEGCAPASVIGALVASSPDHGWRQLAALDHTGASAHFSGFQIKSKHDGVSGADCVAAGNILRDARVPGAMVAAFAAGLGFAPAGAAAGGAGGGRCGGRRGARAAVGRPPGRAHAILPLCRSAHRCGRRPDRRPARALGGVCPDGR